MKRHRIDRVLALVKKKGGGGRGEDPSPICWVQTADQFFPLNVSGYSRCAKQSPLKNITHHNIAHYDEIHHGSLQKILHYNDTLFKKIPDCM